MIYFVVGIAAFVLDLITKISAKSRLQEIGTIPLIEGVFHLTYVENRGAAFGILQGQRWLFVIIAVIFAVVIMLCAAKYGKKSWLLNLGLAFMGAGALGNTVDRICRGYVVDFFDFRLIDFPVFNVADIFVCIGTGLLAIFFVFFEEKFRREREGNENQHR